MEVGHPLAGKTPRTLAVMLLVLAVPYASPRLRDYRVVAAPWDKPTGDTTTTSSEFVTPVGKLGDAALKASENKASVTNALPAASDGRPTLDAVALAKVAGSLAVEDPTEHALDAFYTQLAKTERKEPGAVTRVLHYGDSVITSDLISGTARRLMQARFGDAGHGFILTANPWEWYFHNDVMHTASDGWNAQRITGPFVSDKMYGLGGVSFHTAGAASAWFSTTDKGDYGRSVSHFDIYYLEQPSGGDADLVIPGQKTLLLSTRGEQKVSRMMTVEVPDGAASLSIRTRASGDVRIFGVALEREKPGVVYDALGANGARARLWEGMDADHWSEQMALRKPSLIIVQYGTNESEDGSINGEAYERSLGALVEKLKAAAPASSVMICAPLDRGEKSDTGEIRTRKIVLTLVELQRKVALEHHVAFWNTFEAMGGQGAFARWVKASPQLASWDLTHPTPAGAQVIGDLFFKALTTGFAAYRGNATKGPPGSGARD